MSQFFDRLNEGGPLFMYVILLALLGSIALWVVGLMGKKKPRHVSEIISHVSLFAMMWGFLGSTIGLISAFDAVESIDGGVSQQMFAGGLKVALLCTVFGLFTFVIGRIAILSLTIKAQGAEGTKA